MILRNKGMALAMGCIAIASAGCAPQFIEIEKAPEKSAWVERKAIATSDQIAPVESMEVVLGTPYPNVIGPDERVRWVSGVDVATSRLQRTHQRSAEGGLGAFEANDAQSTLVKSYQFQIRGDQLSVEGQLALETFKSISSDRYYVEFLTSGPMTEDSVNDTFNAWKALMGKLKAKGLNTANVVMGGGKFEQSVNAIVLVRVGK